MRPQVTSHPLPQEPSRESSMSDPQTYEIPIRIRDVVSDEQGGGILDTFCSGDRIVTERERDRRHCRRRSLTF